MQSKAVTGVVARESLGEQMDTPDWDKIKQICDKGNEVLFKKTKEGYIVLELSRKEIVRVTR
jgi:hypothetical protein